MILIFASILSLTGCEKGYLGIAGVGISGGVNSNLEYYKGAIPNSCYSYNYMGDRALKITGKPFMVVKYERSTHYITDFEFGLSEATQTSIGPGPNAIPQPTIDASGLDCYKKCGLKNPVVLLVNYPVATASWSGSNVTIKNGSLGAGGVIFTYTSPYTKDLWTFSYLPAGSMTGGVVMGDGTGVETDDPKISFNLLRQ